jgi:hypothetical protein
MACVRNPRDCGILFTVLWLNHYVEPSKPAGVVFRLNRPFFKALGSEIAFAANDSSID